MPRRRRRRASSPPAVHFDTGASPACTVVEVRADDEPGLVYRITATLEALGCDITFAKIATEKSQALDVFYVTDGSGRALPASEQPRVELALLTALGAKERLSS